LSLKRRDEKKKTKKEVFILRKKTEKNGNFSFLSVFFGNFKTLPATHTPYWTPPTVGHVWGMLKGVEYVQTFDVTIETCSLNLYELGLVIFDWFCFPRPVPQRFPQTSIFGF